MGILYYLPDQSPSGQRYGGHENFIWPWLHMKPYASDRRDNDGQNEGKRKKDSL